MAEARPREERLADFDRKIEQLKAQKKAYLQREKQAERKARTKRLIEIGAVLEHVLGKPIEKSDLPALQFALETLEQNNNNWLTNTMQNYSASQTDHADA